MAAIGTVQHGRPRPRCCAAVKPPRRCGHGDAGAARAKRGAREVWAPPRHQGGVRSRRRSARPTSSRTWVPQDGEGGRLQDLRRGGRRHHDATVLARALSPGRQLVRPVTTDESQAWFDRAVTAVDRGAEEALQVDQEQAEIAGWDRVVPTATAPFGDLIAEAMEKVGKEASSRSRRPRASTPSSRSSRAWQFDRGYSPPTS